MLYKAAAQGARKGKRRVGPPENTLTHWFAAIAQLVEHLIRNEGVGGSNPSCGTIQQLDIKRESAGRRFPYACHSGAADP